jgi:hypothetical protein
VLPEVVAGVELLTGVVLLSEEVLLSEAVLLSGLVTLVEVVVLPRPVELTSVAEPFPTIGVVELTVVTLEAGPVLFVLLELLELLLDGTVEFAEEELEAGALWLLQRLHEFWRITLPKVELIHSAIDSSCWGRLNGDSTAKVAAPSPPWNEVTFPENS